MESIDLLRKWLLNSIVLLVAPGSKEQIWFGTVVCVFGLCFHLWLDPYRHRICSVAQQAVLLQLLLTYITAQLFFSYAVTIDGDSKAHSNVFDVLLIIVNAAAILGSIGFVMYTFYRAVADVSRVLEPPTTKWELSAGSVYSCFLSHYKSEAASDARYLRDVLQRVLNAPVYLDVRCRDSNCLFLLSDVTRLNPLTVVPIPVCQSSELIDLRVLFSDGVHRSDVVVVLATESVLSRAWCLLEIYEAHQKKLPVLFLHVQGKGFDLEDMRDLVGNLETRLPALNSAALQHLRDSLKDTSIQELERVLALALPKASHEMLVYNPNGSDMRLLAEVTDLVTAMADATGRKLEWSGKRDVKWLGQHDWQARRRACLRGQRSSVGDARSSLRETSRRVLESPRPSDMHDASSDASGE
eukprot:2093146-Prymnesium_polylepis.2